MEWLAGQDDAVRERVLAHLDDAAAERLAAEWRWTARAGQVAPDGDWRVWLMMAGRGFGKTRAGAEWVREIAENDPGARIALVGATLGEARGVMVEGVSGLLSIAPWWCRPAYAPALRKLIWPNGAIATLFGAADPEALRGPQFSHGWADEIGKWPGGEAVWDNLMLGMRLGRRPQVLATTTPRPVPLVRRLAAREGVDTVVTRGRTADNAAHLAEGFLAAMEEGYGGTRLGRQELDGELIEEIEGALWTRDLLERCRVRHVPEKGLTRVVVAVDPPASAHGDACGIVVAGLGADARKVESARALLTEAIRTLEEDIREESSRDNTIDTLPSNALPSNDVFVVHGHDETAKEQLARFLEKLGLKAIILHEQPDQGRTIIEKFEDYAEQVGFAVILLTPDDLGAAKVQAVQGSRARQNVIFELGYFAGKLGRGKTCLLRKGDVEIPSDLYGVIYSDLDANGGWKMKLVQEMKAAGLDFDANRAW